MNKWFIENISRYSQISDKIWETPELKFKEIISSKILKKELEKEGFNILSGIADIDTAFVATFGNGLPIIGFLGEFDALDGLSQIENIAESKKKEGYETGHGCGHHLLGVGSLASAVALKEYLVKNKISGTIKYFGCPGEEGGSGKTFMAREGVFDALDAAITWHPGSVNSMFSVSTLSNIQCYFRFKGKSSHAAASPHLGRSALDSVELMNVGVNYLREHIISDARVHYAVTNTGGLSPNVVQAEAEVLYLVRAPKINQAQEIFERIKKIAEGAALMSETKVEIVFDKACSNFIPNVTLSQLMSEIGSQMPEDVFTPEEEKYAEIYFQTLSTQEKKSNFMMTKKLDIADVEILNDLKNPITKKFIPYKPVKFVMPGSTDVGDVSWNTPTVQCMTTCFASGTPAHSWQMVAQGKSSVAHKGMMRAAEIMFLTAVRLIEEPGILYNAKKELDNQLEGRHYECPIPDYVKPKQ